MSVGEQFFRFAFSLFGLIAIGVGFIMFTDDLTEQENTQQELIEHVTSLKEDIIVVYENSEDTHSNDFFALTSNDDVYYITLEQDGDDLSHTLQLVADDNNTLMNMKDASIEYANSWQSSSILFRK